MSHGHDTKHAAHASGDKGAYPHLSSLEVEKLGSFNGGNVLEASKWASVNDPHPTGTLQSPALLAMSKVLGTACIEYNAAFFECKARTRNPEKCEKEGVAVTACAKNVYVNPFRMMSSICSLSSHDGSLQLVRERCQRPYTAYANCLNSNNLEFRYCRDFQNSFHDCALYSSPYSPLVLL